MVEKILKIAIPVVISIITFYYLVIYETSRQKSIKYKVVRKEWVNGEFVTCKYVLGNGNTFQCDCKKYDVDTTNKN